MGKFGWKYGWNIPLTTSLFDKGQCECSTTSKCKQDALHLCFFSSLVHTDHSTHIMSTTDGPFGPHPDQSKPPFTTQIWQWWKRWTRVAFFWAIDLFYKINRVGEQDTSYLIYITGVMRDWATQASSIPQELQISFPHILNEGHHILRGVTLRKQFVLGLSWHQRLSCLTVMYYITVFVYMKWRRWTWEDSCERWDTFCVSCLIHSDSQQLA